MEDSPSFRFASEHHRYPVVALGFLGLSRHMKTQVLDLHYVSKVATVMGHEALDGGVRPVRELRAHPVEAAG